MRRTTASGRLLARLQTSAISNDRAEKEQPTSDARKGDQVPKIKDEGNKDYFRLLSFKLLDERLGRLLTFFQSGTAYDQPLYLRCAFIDFGDARVAVKSLHWKVAQVAVATM